MCTPHSNRTIRHSLTTCALLLLLVCSANAYTIVMRGGKRVEIPSTFVVTQTTVTYEAGPGIQITLQTAAIDVAATEKANHETPGSFMRRAGASVLNTTSTNIEIGNARRTITNRDLEASMMRRRQSEIAYEKRRQELGLPSVEESRRRAAAESARIQEDLGRIKQTQTESESYWRSRASALRSEMAAVDAELNYVRVQLENSSPQLSSGFTSISVPFIAPGISFGGGGFGGRFGNSIGQRRPLVYSAPAGGTQIGGRVLFGTRGTRSGVWLNSGFGRRSFGGSRLSLSPFPVITSGNFYNGASAYDYNYDRSALITHYNELGAARAGLQARWRELEEEARRAGVSPGWLRE